MTTLTPAAILHNLPTAALPRGVLCYAQVGSTMDIARYYLQRTPPPSEKDVISRKDAKTQRPDKELDSFYACSSEIDCTSVRLPLLITADEQITGRGRMHRPWVAPPGSALLFSLAMRPHWLAPANGTMLVWMAGVALCEGIAEATGLSPRLKWPNDIMLPIDTTQTTYHKVAGILLESASSQDAMSWAILGCGINISASPPPDQTRYPATHLEAALNAPVSRLTLLRSLLISMDKWYTRLQQGEGGMLFAAWRDVLITPGQHVTIETANGVRQGYAEGVEPTGALRIRDEAGTLHIITSGDVGI